MSSGDAYDNNKSLSAGLQNFTGATIEQQFLRGMPSVATYSNLPSNGFVSGATDHPRCNCQKASGTPAQLTIFYAGKVYVYNDISPEKAQAIMILTENACTSSTVAMPKLQVEAPVFKHAAGDGVETKASKALGISNTLVSFGSTIPQPPKASLSQFLQKRKERLMNSSPYNRSKK